MDRKRKRTPTRLLSMDYNIARPCEVDGRPALFHRWVEEYDLSALVEYQDGTIDLVRPDQIRFVKEA